MSILKGVDFKTLLFQDEQSEVFYTALQDFSANFGGFYFSYLYEDLERKVRTGFTSNPVWQKAFVENRLMDHCHICTKGINHGIQMKKAFLILPWEILKPSTSIEKDVVLYRSEMGIGQNGLSFLTLRNNTMESIAIAPEVNNSKFVLQASKNLDIIKKHVTSFRIANNNLIK